MPNTLQQGVLSLLHSAINGQPTPLPQGFSLEEAMPLIKKHQIGNMIYYGAVNCGIDKQLPAMRELFAVAYQCLLIDERQRSELKKLMNAFNDKGIRYMPIKGASMKSLYPRPEMRRMGDADILIQQEQYPLIKQVLKELGYVYIHETDHEIVWHHKQLHLELHKKLMPSRHKAYDMFFKDGWERARLKKDASYLYEMSPEDTMLYLITHVAKHYVCGGIGIQHLMDLWIYQRCYPKLDWHYIAEAIKQLGLEAFFGHILYTLAVWFEDAPEDAVSEQMTEYVFQSGVFGTHKNKVLAEATDSKRSGKGKWLWKTVFLDLGNMKVRYPLLDKYPVLLPAMWIVRGFDLLFVHRERVVRKIQDIRQATQEDVGKMKAHLKLMGLKE